MAPVRQLDELAFAMAEPKRKAAGFGRQLAALPLRCMLHNVVVAAAVVTVGAVGPARGDNVCSNCHGSGQVLTSILTIVSVLRCLPSARKHRCFTTINPDACLDAIMGVTCMQYGAMLVYRFQSVVY